MQNFLVFFRRAWYNEFARPCLKDGKMLNGERFFRQSRQIFAGGLSPGKKI
jgi:hypothetical protein